MPQLTASDLFDSSDPLKNRSDIFRNTVVAGLYSTLRLLVLDVFTEQYNESYFLPQSFRLQHKKVLQGLMKDFDYSMVQKDDKPFLIHVFNEYSDFAGVHATRLLLDWMRNAADFEAASTIEKLSDIKVSIRRKELTLQSPLPLRLERYFSFENLLRDNFFNTGPDYSELSPDWFETSFDLAFYKQQEHDYYGEKENTFDASDWAFAFANTLLGKVAWENTCQGYPPAEQEMAEISQWMAQHKKYWEIGNNKMQDLFISPLLKEDLLKRRIIATP